MRDYKMYETIILIIILGSLVVSAVLYLGPFTVCYFHFNYGKFCEDSIFTNSSNNTCFTNNYYEIFTGKINYMVISAIDFVISLLVTLLSLYISKCNTKHYSINKYNKIFTQIMLTTTILIFIGVCVSIVSYIIGYYSIWFFADQNIIKNMYIITITTIGYVIINLITYTLIKLVNITDLLNIELIFDI